MIRRMATCLTLAFLTVLAGCGSDGWTATRISVIPNGNMPECVAIDSSGGVVYISNMVAPEKNYWEADGKGFITKAALDGKVLALRWRVSTDAVRLSKPKGTWIQDGMLYVADIDGVAIYNLRDGSARRLTVPGGKMLNDVAAFGGAVYVSDTATGLIHKLGDPGATIAGCEAINGITFTPDGRLFAVSWGLHEVFELDPKGKTPPKPFGLADQFKNLDAIEVLDDGTFLVTDYTGGRLVTISPDRKTVRTLAEFGQAADVALDRKTMRLYATSMVGNEVIIFQLAKD